MSADDVTVVWMAPEGAREDAAHALAEWGRARGLRLVPPADAQSAALRVDLVVGDRVEKELERAREAISAADADGAERSLARAEALLRDHPELPQAAWLRAEVSRGWSSRFMRLDPRDDARAESAWQDADALDGGRVAGVGEGAFPRRAAAHATVVVDHAEGQAVVVRLDGVALTGAPAGGGRMSYAVDVPAAEHQLVVALGGEPVFASWVALAPAAAGAPRSTIAVPLPEGGACGASSFEHVTRADGGVRAPGVTCARWVAAVAGEARGSVLVARCERDACGPLLEWRTETMAPGPAPTPRGKGWPAWATWTLVGFGAATATAMTLVATGAFESRPTEPRFVAGGVRVETR